MDRFEAIEKIFKEEGNIEVNGKGLWEEIEQCVMDTGNEIIETYIYIDGTKYGIEFAISKEDKFFDENDNEVSAEEDFSYATTDINIKSIQVSKYDGSRDEHCFVYNF